MLVIETEDPCVSQAGLIPLVESRDPRGGPLFGGGQPVPVGFELFDERGLHLEMADREVGVLSAVLDIEDLEGVDLDLVLEVAVSDGLRKDDGQGDRRLFGGQAQGLGHPGVAQEVSFRFGVSIAEHGAIVFVRARAGPRGR